MKCIIISGLTICVVGLLLFTGCAILRPNAPLPDRSVQAVWVWNTDELCSRDAADSFVSFCKANEVRMVFLYLQGDFHKIRYLVSVCSDSDIMVHALTGTPEMAKAENHKQAVNFVSKVLRYNSDSKRNERISGIHLDVEPYLLDEFKSGGTEKVLNDYIQLMNTVRTDLRKQDRRMLFGADIPFWFDSRIGDGTPKYAVESGAQWKPAYQHVIDVTDYICIMAYRTDIEGKDGVIELSKDELAYSSAKGKKVFVGLETGSGEGIPEKTTFANKDIMFLRKSVSILVEMLSDEPCFTGVAIHHYKAWHSLGE